MIKDIFRQITDLHAGYYSVVVELNSLFKLPVYIYLVRLNAYTIHLVLRSILIQIKYGELMRNVQNLLLVCMITDMAKERREEKKPLSAPPTPRQKLPEVPDQEKKEETVTQTETVAHQLEIGESQNKKIKNKDDNIVTPKTGTVEKILNQNPPEKKEQMEKLRLRSQNKLL
ncbi:hypothetical protein JTB14_037849 [Gonioctena quinquepunctata]|nr:hypothetical protein JTB14_037849 [Gonioctena quinquepunctata]